MLLPLSFPAAALLPITVIKEEQLALVRVESSLQSPQKLMKNRSPFFHWILDQIQRDLMV